jgi:hypothetical protein
MFRFSIREMMLVTLVVAFGVAWFMEHRRCQEATTRSDGLQSTVNRMDTELNDVGKQLRTDYGLGLLRTMYVDGRPGAEVTGNPKIVAEHTARLLDRAP